jgi:uncharacterized membrane protein YeaQ/YmgE (transglycosylase-associated protein family)
MAWLVTLVIGGIVGWLGSIVMKTNAQMGLVANIVVGIIGAAIGNWLAAQVGMATAGIAGWVVAVIGAMICIGVLKVLGIFK